MTMRICGIYSITNTVNEKKSIGQSIDCIDRWRRHKSDLNRNAHENPHLQNAWNKYGKSNFRFDILLLCPIEELNKEEIRLIQEYRTTDRNLGYNIDGGGKANKIVSAETRKKISLACTGRKHSEDTKQKMKNAWKNKSEETKQKMQNAMREALRKRTVPFHLSEKTKEKLRSAHLGKQHSEETKQKIREANPFLGKTLPKETKQKMKESHLGKQHSEETKQKIREIVRERWRVRKEKLVPA